jgi:hypothetical protein
MAQFRRSPANIKSLNLNSGPYLARVVGHLDPTFSGGLQVTLLRPEGNKLGDENHVYTVKFASPFFGSTAFEFMGKNTASRNLQDATLSNTQDAFNDTQKSYGMWFVPPDVGVTVLVVFVNGDSSNGFWIACVPPTFNTHMVPAIGGSEAVDLDDADKKKFATKQPLPVAEVNKRINKIENRVDIDNIKKPLHPIAEAFLKQGLLEDDIRGVTTTTSRREVPSAVFGISTPGPLDKRPGSKRAPIGKIQNKSPNPVPVSRLGGTTLVMDDGDDRYQRKKPAGELGQGDAYIDILDPNNKEKGDPTIPYNEYFRVRTRTGHQILLHNSEDLIYIGNAKGTTWIELTSNGKIDIYAQDSISIHTETDLNILADRDINLEAGRNVNIKANNRLHLESTNDTELVIGKNGFITTSNNLDINTKLANKFTAGTSTDINSGTSSKFTASSSTDILTTSGNHTETASIIHMNGPTASQSEKAETKEPLVTHPNIITDPLEGWDKRYQKSTPIESIMKRIPMHEPWPLHENFSPDLLTPENTDREI